MKQAHVTGLLAALLVFDVVLSVTAFFFPQLWFDIFHGVNYVDPQGFLYRCAANWTAFALFQAVALIRWKRESWWLLIVAGVRFSDIFTDLTYYFVATDTTWFAFNLLLMGPVNFALGLLLVRMWKRFRS